LSAAALVANYRYDDARARLLPDPVITLFSDPRPLSAFALADHDDRVFDLTRLRGKWTFIFFGYTYCPDVCPTTLAQLARVRDRIATPQAPMNEIQFVFVSVDPNRDSARHLKQYVAHFNATFIGVTGGDREIANLTAQMGARYDVLAESDTDSYPVSHTDAVFLVDPRARHLAVFKPPYDADAISARFNLVRRLEGKS
jgi:protein SCO1/2